MSCTKLATGVAVVLAAAAVVGVASSTGQMPGPTPAPAEPAKPAAAAPGAAPSDYFQRRDGLDRLKRVSDAVHAFVKEHGHFPANVTDAAGRPLLSWRVAILPYLGEGYLFEQFRTAEPWDGDHNRKLLAYVPKAYRTPGAAAGETRVQGFAGPGTAFEPGRRLRPAEDFPDGTSNTILAVEAGPAVPWAKPADLPFDRAAQFQPPAGPFADGFASVWADGPARWLPMSSDKAKTLRDAVGRDDNEVMNGAELEWSPGPPRLTPAEQAEADRLDREYAKFPGGARQLAEQRYRYETELRKLGPLPTPKLSGEGSVDAARAAYRRLERYVFDTGEEVRRLREELEWRDPPAAARLRKEFEPKPGDVR